MPYPTLSINAEHTFEAERSKQNIFSKGPRNKQFYDCLRLGIETAQTLTFMGLNTLMYAKHTTSPASCDK